MTEHDRPTDHRGMFQQRSDWRTRQTGDRELLTKILAAPNPIIYSISGTAGPAPLRATVPAALYPIPNQIPQLPRLPMGPSTQAGITALIRAIQNHPDSKPSWMFGGYSMWPEDHMDEVRAQVQRFIDRHGADVTD